MKELPLNILLVEDDQDDIDLLQEILIDNNIDFILDYVREGDLVLPHLESCKVLPNIIVLDLNLPKMHGKDILVKVKTNPEFKHIPVAILTTSSAKKDIEFCMENGADKFLIKPSTVDGFKATVSALINAAV